MLYSVRWPGEFSFAMDFGFTSLIPGILMIGAFYPYFLVRFAPRGPDSRPNKCQSMGFRE